MGLPERDWIETRESMGSFDHPVDKVRMLKDKVLVKPDPFVEKTEGGIYLHPERLEEQHSGEIIKVGSKVTGVKVGEKVLFNRHEGVVIEYSGVRYVMMREREIKAVSE